MALQRLQIADACQVSQHANSYDLEPLTAPRLVGLILRCFVWLVESWIFLPFRYLLERQNKIPQTLLETVVDEAPLYMPLNVIHDETIFPNRQFGLADPATRANLCSVPSGTQSVGQTRRTRSAAELREAYSSGKNTPTQIAQNAVKHILESQKASPAMNYFTACDVNDVLQQAAQSTIRYKQHKTLSALDGVPYAVKDMIDAMPYETTCGTTYMPTIYKAEQDHPMVAAMRATGAVLLGKTNLHELGVSPLGVNMHYGIIRNPHDPSCFAGGSSSGSAAVVAAGLCPFAIGNDGGGSIRVPAACCGVVGLKPTWGRDCLGSAPKGVPSLTCTGPIAATVADAQAMYAVIGNAGDRLQGPAPPVSIPLTLPTTPASLRGKRLGIFWDWFNDADPEVVDICKSALNLLCAGGAEVVPFSIPDLNAARISHNYTFGSEAGASHAHELQDAKLRRQMAADVRITLALGQGFKSQHFIQAQRIRRRMVTYMEKVFDAADFIVTPTVPYVAPKIRPDILSAGESDLTTVGRLLRFVFLSNFTGHPAIALPVGHTHQGLPVSLQLIGRPWAEADLLHIGSIVESCHHSKLRKPAVFYDIASTD